MPGHDQPPIGRRAMSLDRVLESADRILQERDELRAENGRLRGLLHDVLEDWPNSYMGVGHRRNEPLFCRIQTELDRKL